MNKTSHTDEPLDGDDGYNQSPNPLSNDLTTNEDFNGIANSRVLGEHDSQSLQGTASAASQDTGVRNTSSENDGKTTTHRLAYRSLDRGQPAEGDLQVPAIAQPPSHSPTSAGGGDVDHRTLFQRLKKNALTFCSFIGPGFMISVAYSTSSPPSRCSHAAAYTDTLTRAQQSTLAITQQTSLLEPRTAFVCSSLSSSPTYSPSFSRVWLLSLAPLAGSTLRKPVGPFSHDGSTTFCTPLRRLQSSLRT